MTQNILLDHAKDDSVYTHIGVKKSLCIFSYEKRYKIFSENFKNFCNEGTSFRTSRVTWLVFGDQSFTREGIILSVKINFQMK